MVDPLDIEATSADLGRVRGLLHILAAGLAAQPVKWASEVSGAIERRGWTAEDEHAFKEAVRRHPATLSKLLNNDVDAGQDLPAERPALPPDKRLPPVDPPS